jgi:cutinase
MQAVSCAWIPRDDVSALRREGTPSRPFLGRDCDNLRGAAVRTPRLGGRPVGVYAVNYPATEDFTNSASAGAVDARAHVQSVAANCPNTRIVLGGYSQGAIVIDLITAMPVSVAGFTPAPMPPDVADHVAAVAVFGNPVDRFVGAPLTAISPEYGAKAIDLCAAGDPICSPGGDMAMPQHDEMFSEVHLSYVKSGMASQGAAFAASHL